ncbi:MAG: pilus assembly protein [Pseudomonadota bacterium]
MLNFKAFARAFAKRGIDIRRCEAGTISVEAILMFPLLLWAYMAMFSFFEGFRENNINLKAAYTVGDLLSRETRVINDEYMGGMRDVFGWLTRTPGEVEIRVTVVAYDEDSDTHRLLWSRDGDGAPGLTQEGVDSVVTPHVPIMANAATAIVVETWATFEPFMEIGFENTEIYNIVVTSPRFPGHLVYEGLNDGTGTEHDDGTGEPSDV